MGLPALYWWSLELGAEAKAAMSHLWSDLQLTQNWSSTIDFTGGRWLAPAVNLIHLFLEVAFAPGAKSGLTSMAHAAVASFPQCSRVSLSSLVISFLFCCFELKFFSSSFPVIPHSGMFLSLLLRSGLFWPCVDMFVCLNWSCFEIPLFCLVCFPNCPRLMGEGCLWSCPQWSHITACGPVWSHLRGMEHLRASPSRCLSPGLENRLPEVSPSIRAWLKLYS